MSRRPEELTRTLDAAGRGEAAAAEQLLPLMYEELVALARSRMSRLPPGDTLQPTALVHEAYLRLVGEEDPGWEGRRHFFGAAARAMRNILVDRARAKGAVKRGGDRRRVGDLDGLDAALLQTPVEDVLALDEALDRLEREDARKAQIVMLRFFAGLASARIAELLGISLPTVERDWRYARAWLLREMAGGETRSGAGEGGADG